MDLKAVLVIFSFVVLTVFDLTQAISHAEIDELGRLCKGTAEDIATVKKWQVPNTESGKCFMKCIATHFGMFHDDGSFNAKSTASALKSAWPGKPAEHVDSIIQHCDPIMRSRPKAHYHTCQISYDAMKCVNDIAHELGWFKDA